MQEVKKNKVLKQQLRRLTTKMEKIKAKEATGKSKAKDVLELERTKQGSGKQLTLKGTLALAIRRNFGNAATADVGAMLLEDISRFTVARAETKAGTCLIASARIFFHWVYSELTGPQLPDSFRLVVHSYRQDATNSGILKRSKLNALILHSAFLRQREHLHDQSWKQWENFDFHDWFDSMVRVADVLPVLNSTSEDTVAQTLKHLASLGCTTWKDIQADVALQVPRTQMSEILGTVLTNNYKRFLIFIFSSFWEPPRPFFLFGRIVGSFLFAPS